MQATVLQTRWPFEPGGGRLDEPLSQHLALCFEGAYDAPRCQQLAQAVMSARDHWNSDFGGEQHSLGRAWYVHLEEDNTVDYFADAEASDALVERVLPGVQAELRAMLSRLVGAPVTSRKGWCGPGVHIFLPHTPVARRGGVVHADNEGLTERHRTERKPALSMVLMLQPPLRGGGLRLWDATTDTTDEIVTGDLVGVDSALLVYRPGDLVVFDSYRLHQIQPFGGQRPRISLTVHSARRDDGTWEAWF